MVKGGLIRIKPLRKSKYLFVQYKQEREIILFIKQKQVMYYEVGGSISTMLAHSLSFTFSVI